MRIAITTWQGRISPVFDSSQWLQLFDDSGVRLFSEREYIGDEAPFGKVERIKKLGADILICGAITRPLQFDLANSNIRVYPFVCGDVAAVLDAFIRQHDIDDRFAMPGRRRRRRNRRGRP
ncbi:dinitrogenase iron-molybdenum cofactor biosynthesis protein [candidate division KSB1 bacterium]|nr:NifB/NifX family molybdenum-iron cluster-binding protein [candidate division KSB1 bacterium]RQW03836.1 MAG: dinitrogenase iron-molybdenum cofactor biosynthesis protein [candidate division KSB1 bacterium]